MKALVTGFDPFGGETVNAAWSAVRRLPSRLGELEIVTAQLPTVFGRSVGRLGALIEGNRPDLVLCVGQAGSRTALSLERVAVNLDDARIPDNDDCQPVDQPVVADGPAAYFTTLPVKAAVAALRRAGLPAEVSQTAGSFVCNHVFYALMHLIATRHPRLRGGCLHVPSLLTMPVGEVARGIEIILATVVATRTDIAVPEGTVD